MKILILPRRLIMVLLQYKLPNYGTKTRVEFNRSCLKQGKVTFNHGTLINIYIVYEINRNCKFSSYPTLKKNLFGAVSLTKHANIDQYKYFRFGIGFDRHGFFSYTSGETGSNVIIFRLDMS